ncbi:MAG: hypothetical protein AAGA25_15540 [Planctomycetota bacterium]
MKWKSIGLIAVALALGPMTGAQEVVFDISSEADVRRLLPKNQAKAKGMAGRGGLKVRTAQGPGGGSAILIGGKVDGSLYANATYGDVLLPGTGYHGINIDPEWMGRPYTIQYEVYLGAGHGVQSMSLSTRFMADLDDNQIVKFEDPGNEFAHRLETFAAVGGPDLAVVDAWQTVSTTAVIPTADKAGNAIGQMNVSINLGTLGAPKGQVWVRNIRLTLDEPAAETPVDPPAEDAPPAQEEVPEPE